jgi:hypothetical protein
MELKDPIKGSRRFYGMEDIYWRAISVACTSLKVPEVANEIESIAMLSKSSITTPPPFGTFLLREQSLRLHVLMC